jgi:hypothetical protein
MDISPFYSPYTVKRSCFVKRFSKTILNSLENLIHQHCHSRSCYSHNITMPKAPYNFTNIYTTFFK